MFPNKSLGRGFKQATAMFISHLNPNAWHQMISQNIASKAEKGTELFNAKKVKSKPLGIILLS